jgi:hypothetical protein
MRALPIAFLLAFGLQNASATVACSTGAADKIPVVYFGGYKSTFSQMAAWQAQAAASSYGNKFHFEAHTLYDAPSDEQAVLHQAQNKINIDSCVKLIDNPNFKGPIVLAGHSDGSWMINEIARRAKNKSKIRIENLDGYYPRRARDKATLKGVHMNCWTTYTSSRSIGQARSCSKIPAGSTVSKYKPEMARCSSCIAIAVSGCHDDVWCLHFANTNQSAPKQFSNGMNLKSWLKLGYQDLKPRLHFLDPLLNPDDDSDDAFSGLLGTGSASH